MSDLVLAPLVDYGFMRTGLLAALIVGGCCALLSCLLVVRGRSLLGDAVSHSVLLGVVIGYLVGGEFGILPGAMLVAAVSGAAISFVARRTPLEAETAMGVVFTPLFALGLAIISVVQPRGIDLFHVLFGNVLGVSPSDVWLTGVAAGLVVAVVLVGFRAFELWSFDPVLAACMGMRTGAMDHLFTALLSAAIVAALKTVGLVLVVAMLILPGATAALVCRRLATMMALAVAVGMGSGVVGLYGSYHLDVASGPAIVLAASGAFVVVLLLAPRSGLLTGRWTHWRLRTHRNGAVGGTSPTTDPLGTDQVSDATIRASSEHT